MSPMGTARRAPAAGLAPRVLAGPGFGTEVTGSVVSPGRPQRRSRSSTCRCTSSGEPELSTASSARVAFSVSESWALSRSSTSFGLQPRPAARRRRRTRGGHEHRRAGRTPYSSRPPASRRRRGPPAAYADPPGPPRSPRGPAARSTGTPATPAPVIRRGLPESWRTRCRPPPARFTSPAASRIAGPQRATSFARTSGCRSASWPRASATITFAPRRANAWATVLLPLPMPPTRPMTVLFTASFEFNAIAHHPDFHWL